MDQPPDNPLLPPNFQPAPPLSGGPAHPPLLPLPQYYPFALQRLRKHVEQEALRCWGMVGVLALSSIGVGYALGMLIMLGVNLSLYSFNPNSNNANLMVPAAFGIGASVIIEALSMLIAPVIIIVIAL